MLVALCDDENAQLDQLEGYLKKYESVNEIQTSRYNSGAQLLEEYKAGTRYDIIFLDIMMKPMNGLDVARQIRETDHKAIIIFLTNLLEFAVDGYEVHAFRYLIKPLSEAKFDTVFYEALHEESTRQKRYYIINSKENEIIKLDVQDIIYLESFGRNMSAHLVDREIQYVSSISTVENKLSAFGFMRIHKSYVVNFEYIFHISRSLVTLKNGVELPLSRQRQKIVLDAFTQHLASSAV